ncbi:F-box domain [Arabidopsis thaliana x Arabidopsis arenosa]|uniref:F-box domain n=1 Tax=Arabidopsis thaliana x Arabidopsis arenosa TaxID=1240361 RepID=A0A8T1Z155_9BRAS|nr:F-box domain [Arabidopsis thaliana x Arabidopsis arenosa]
MSTDLPPEVVEEILSRVPAIALKRLGSTCKRWNALLKDQRFTKKHFHRAAKQFMVFMMHQKRLISVRFNLHEIENNLAAPFIEFKGEVGLTQTIKQFLFHCDGLLLCNTKTDRLKVWNPCTGETKFIRSCNRYEIYSMFALGYEDNKSFRKYKLLRFYGNEYRFVNFEIYEFTSSTWRVLEVTTNFLIRSHGVSLKGNSFWLDSGSYLLSFDFTTERFGHQCLPFTVNDAAALSIVREEKLSVLHQSACIKEIERICSAFLWSGPELNSKKAKVAWRDVCRPKDEGGLGLKSIVEAKKRELLRNGSFWSVKVNCQSGSWMWRMLLKYRSQAAEYCLMEVKSRLQVSFWYDKWCSIGPLYNHLGNRGFVDLGLSSTSSVADALRLHRRRHHRTDYLNKVEVELDRFRNRATTTENDVALWRGLGDKFRPKFSTRETWLQPESRVKLCRGLRGFGSRTQLLSTHSSSG